MRLFEAKLLKEGGDALKSAGVGRIAKGDIPATINYIAKLSGIPSNELTPLGSVGKTKTSGDIDLAVNVNNYNPIRIHEKMLKALGGDDFGIYNKGTRVGSYAVPVPGKKDKLVQVDFMFVENPTWAQFAYFSPGDKSKYAGAVRNILLSSVAATLDDEGVDKFVYDGDDLIVRIGRGIDMSVGLKRLFQLKPRKKTGEGYLKNLQKVTADDIKQAYPDLEFDGTDLVVDNPSDVSQILFGQGVRPGDIDTAEEVIKLIKKFPQQRQELIMQIAKGRSRQLVAKGLDLPKDLQ